MKALVEIIQVILSLFAGNKKERLTQPSVEYKELGIDKEGEEMGITAKLSEEDLEHAKEFLHRQQDKLCYASDCADVTGEGDGCSGAKQLAVVRELVEDEAVLNKILALNARRVLKI